MSLLAIYFAGGKQAVRVLAAALVGFRVPDAIGSISSIRTVITVLAQIRQKYDFICAQDLKYLLPEKRPAVFTLDHLVRGWRRARVRGAGAVRIPMVAVVLMIRHEYRKGLSFVGAGVVRAFSSLDGSIGF